MHSECQVCNKPLGQESKDLGFTVCHEHRNCVTCQLPVLPCEATYCISNKLTMKHAKCVTEKDFHIIEGMGLKPTVDLLNLSRLLSNATKDLEEIRSLDKTFEWLRLLQAEAAKVSVLVRMDKKSMNELLTKEKHTKEAEIARLEAKTSSRPIGKSPTAEDEQRIAAWMKVYNISERKLAIADLKNRDKTIKQLTDVLHIPFDIACKTVLEQFDKKYGINTQGEERIN